MKGITVDGVQLSEYLRDKESIQENIERNKLFNNSIDNHNLNRYVKPKYRDRKEKNGKVIRLSQLEINKQNYEPYLKQALEDKKYNDAFVISLVYHYDEEYVDLPQLIKFIEKFAKSRNIPLVKGFGHGLRATAGHVRRNELKQYLYFLDRKNSKNKANRLMFGIDIQKAKDLNIDDFLDLAHTPSRTNIQKSRRKLNQNPTPEIKINTLPDIEADNLDNISKQDRKEPSELNSLTTNIIKGIKDLSGNGSFLTIQGDLHIHIHIDKP